MHLTISVLRFPPYQSSDKNQTWPANNAHAIMFSNPPTSNICPVPSCSFFLSFFFLLQVVLDSSSVEGFLHKRRNLFFFLRCSRPSPSPSQGKLKAKKKETKRMFGAFSVIKEEGSDPVDEGLKGGSNGIGLE